MIQRYCVIFCVLALAACGFKPVHGRDYQVQRDASMAGVLVQVDNSRLGQLLKAEIERGVNPDFERAEKLYALDIALKERNLYLFINPDGTAGRGDVQFESTYALTRRVDGKVLKSGRLRRVASYNISETADYATYVSQEDARKRGIIELANDYKLRLANLMEGLDEGDAP